MLTPRLVLAVVAVAAVLAVASARPFGGGSTSPASVSLTSWTLVSSANLTGGETGATLSSPSYDPPLAPAGPWFNITGPATVLAGLVQAGVVVDPFYGENLAAIGVEAFEVPWWYRAEFSASVSAGETVRITFKGLNYRANVWLNGVQIGSQTEVVGSFRYFDFVVTDQVVSGVNALAVECFRPVDSAFPPTNNDTDLAITFVDWAPPPPDNNMGIWREVEVVILAGSVSVRYPLVVTELGADGTTALLTVEAELQNYGAVDETVTIDGSIDGTPTGTVTFSQSIVVPANSTMAVAFNYTDFPQLKVANARLWWPAQLGTPEMHNLTLKVHDASGAAWDTLAAPFGMRKAHSALNEHGYLQYYINNVPLLIRGGGWAPDLFLRASHQRHVDEVSYALAMGLNAIRLEGKMNNDDFFDVTDEAGVVVLTGWCCCDAWQHWQYWGPEQYVVAGDSLRDQLMRMRIHPSAIAFWYSSDQLPPPNVEQEYLNIFEEVSWPNGILASASNLTSNLTGNTGVKMSGPYAWVPPNYFLENQPGDPPFQLGGGYGFLTEGGPGASPMLVQDIEAVMPEADVWPISNDWDWHCGNQAGLFGNLRFFTPPQQARYGTSDSAAAYAYRAQMGSYETHRAMFEAYSRNAGLATGVVQWMLNSAFPSNMWNLYAYSLSPGGAFFGTQRACEPLHVMWSYNDGSVWVINSDGRNGGKSPAALTVTATAYDTTGALIDSQQQNISTVMYGSPENVLTFSPTVHGHGKVYFIDLALTAGSATYSRNTYWLTNPMDELDWSASNFYITPVKKYADFSDLNTMVSPSYNATDSIVRNADGTVTATVTITVASPGVVFGLYARYVDANMDDVVPIIWDDNFVTLFGPTTRVLTATFTQPTGSASLVVQDYAGVV